MEEIILFANIAQNLSQIASDTAERFGINWPHFISQVISFLIVAFLLHRFAYKPILNVLEKRRQRIAESLENSERIKQELAETERNRKEVLNQANEQANKMIQEARDAAARIKEQETQKAITEAQEIRQKAQQAAEADRARMEAELKQEIGRLVVETTAKVTGKVLNDEDQRRLAEEANQHLAA